MSRLIDADALMEASQYEFWQDGSAITPIGEYILGKFRQLIRNMPTVTQEPRWIPCSERLPEEKTVVLVSFDNGEVKILWQDWANPDSEGNYPNEPLAYAGGDEIPYTAEDWKKYKTYAVAWMPLPEPYREEGK